MRMLLVEETKVRLYIQEIGFWMQEIYLIYDVFKNNFCQLIVIFNNLKLNK